MTRDLDDRDRGPFGELFAVGFERFYNWTIGGDERVPLAEGLVVMALGDYVCGTVRVVQIGTGGELVIVSDWTGAHHRTKQRELISTTREQFDMFVDAERHAGRGVSCKFIGRDGVEERHDVKLQAGRLPRVWQIQVPADDSETDSILWPRTYARARTFNLRELMKDKRVVRQWYEET